MPERIVACLVTAAVLDPGFASTPPEAMPRRADPVLGLCRCRADHVGHRHVMRYCSSSA
ncbi:MAG: hypothetical protein ACRDRR_03185 [Pseudonocardiaceae bacterium]